MKAFHANSPLLSLRCIAIVAATLALWAVAGGSLHADVFLLRSGGRIEGELLNRDGPLAAPYQVRTSAGLTVEVDRQDVSRVVSQRDDKVAYEVLAPKVADTVEQQWKLAQWCRDRHLTKEREVHLRRILKLDPDHLPARRALGYAQVEGQWLTREQWRAKGGYVYYQGRWRLPQEVEVIQSKTGQRLAEKQWLLRLRNWREQLVTEDGAKARDALLAIDDPQAVSAIAQYLLSDPLRPAKMIYITVLLNIGDGACVQALVDSSLQDQDEEVSVNCIDAIEQLDPPGVVTAYVQALGHKNNHVVNRAAYALSRLGDSTVVPSLIDALVTMHTFTYQPNRSASPDTITTSFVNDQREGAAAAPPLMPKGSGLSVGDGKKTTTRRVNNEEVHRALLQLTRGPNYGYNQQVWQQWLESQHQSANLDGRRQ